MKRYNGFEARRTTSKKNLPVGGYVATIMKAEDMSFTSGPALAVSFEIAEGKYAGFFAEDYRHRGRALRAGRTYEHGR